MSIAKKIYPWAAAVMLILYAALFASHGDARDSMARRDGLHQVATVRLYDSKDQNCNVRIDARHPNGAIFPDRDSCNGIGSVRQVELTSLPSESVVTFYQDRGCNLSGNVLRLVIEKAGGRKSYAPLKMDLARDTAPNTSKTFTSPDGTVRIVATSSAEGTPAGGYRCVTYETDMARGARGAGGTHGIAWIRLFDGNNFTGSNSCSIMIARVPFVERVTLKGHPECWNDEAASMRLENIPAGSDIQIYDSWYCNVDWPYAYVKVLRTQSEPIKFPTFERNVTEAPATLSYHTVGSRRALDHEVSCLAISIPE